ncbi:hypothetical protein CRUP_034333 [Coryphaenoides rupestris]|nr:hypothetical protein CRUP_034333 [Coryphaenoides rupestris]
METVAAEQKAALTRDTVNVLKAAGSHSSRHRRRRSRCRGTQVGLEATARSATLSFFSSTARYEARRPSAESDSPSPNAAALCWSWGGKQEKLVKMCRQAGHPLVLCLVLVVRLLLLPLALGPQRRASIVHSQGREEGDGLVCTIPGPGMRRHSGFGSPRDDVPFRLYLEYRNTGRWIKELVNGSSVGERTSSSQQKRLDSGATFSLELQKDTRAHLPVNLKYKDS